MKRFILLLLATVMLFSMAGCSSRVPQTDMEATLSRFTEALKVYDRDQMTTMLTEFPDNSEYVYLDDIFNDDPYIELYRVLFADITYEIKSAQKNKLIVAYTMPDVQNLYSTVSSLALQLAMSDESFQDKLAENDENGIVFIQEMMLYLALQGKEIETMTQEFTLTFKEAEQLPVIVCNDELRALITGNFFLSKNMKQSEIAKENTD